MLSPFRTLTLAAFSLLAIHCSAPPAHDDSSVPDGADAVSTGDSNPLPDAPVGSDVTGDAPIIPPTSGPFLYGINFGYWGPQLSDDDSGLLASQSGATTSRPKFSEYFFDHWGYDVRVNTMMAHARNGLARHAAFLIGPSAAHSTAPAGTPEWQLDQYIPTNLYEPITLADGTVNPNNYWAQFVFHTVQTYHQWVDTWEIWNEPDWVSDWHVVDGWRTLPPTAAQLVRFHGDIFAYVRMLRVARVAAQLADPHARIAVGGLGYPPFLSAILRYTDNPAGGSVTPDFPQTGGAYFDVLSMHYYPLYGPGPSSDEGVDGFVQLRDQFATVLHDAGVTGKSWLCTETGAPAQMFGTQPGGVTYARNYDLKVMTTAASLGFDAVHWFVLSNGAATSTTPYDFMGWYSNLTTATVSTALRTDTGEAQRTLHQVLADPRFDAAATTALALPSTARGAAFRRADGTLVLVLWALTHGPTEDATATVTVPSTSGFDAYAWDGARTGMHSTVAASGGHAMLTLHGDPQLFVAHP